MASKIRVVELFAGVGGFRLGLERASNRYKIVWSNQWEPSTSVQHASEIYVKNFGSENHHNCDISTVHVKEIPDHDLLVGGFPCQDYSVARTLNHAKGLRGKKGVLWWEIHRIVEAKRPKYLFLENVDRLLKSPAKQRGRDFAIMLASLSDLGYAVEWRVINAADYGMPQKRRRAFILAYRKGTAQFARIARTPTPVRWLDRHGVFATAVPVEQADKLVNMFDIRGELADISEGFNRGEIPNQMALFSVDDYFEPIDRPSPFANTGLVFERRVITFSSTPNYTGPRTNLGDILLKNGFVPFEYLLTPDSLPRWAYLKGSKSEKRKNRATGFEYQYTEGSLPFPDPLDRPARTIITGEGGVTPSRFKHVVRDDRGHLRRLTPIELERLNMFPDNYTFGVSDIRRAFFMGNALVVGIVEKVASILAAKANRITEKDSPMKANANVETEDSIPTTKRANRMPDLYDKTNPQSIEAYARNLIDKSLREVLGDEVSQRFSGKGRLGQLVEELYFGYKPNSRSEPDFVEAGLELKTAGLVKKGKSLQAKERLVLNNIDYCEEYKYTFRTSSFFRKNALLLLLFYLYEQGKLDLDVVFKIVTTWEFPETDLKIIEDDWTKIIGKIVAGKADEISEGDTLYLAACMHGATKAKAQTKQPFSQKPATKRAFSLKARYVNFIVEEGLKRQTEPAVKTLDQYIKDETFEEFIIRQFRRFKGLSENEVVKELGIPTSIAKSHLYIVAREIVKRILGVSKEKIQEFEKAGLVMKTVNLEPNGRLKESMSFAQIKFKDILEETWENSYLFNTITRRFFFVVFRKAAKTGVSHFEKVFFWTMPAEGIEVAKEYWEDIRTKIRADDYESFWAISDNRTFHVRPKGVRRDGTDVMETPSGRFEEKLAYWLNASYIRKVIEDS